MKAPTFGKGPGVGGSGVVILGIHPELMATPNTATIRCVDCGTEFSATDEAELQNHDGHELVHIDPGGDPQN